MCNIAQALKMVCWLACYCFGRLSTPDISHKCDVIRVFVKPTIHNRATGRTAFPDGGKLKISGVSQLLILFQGICKPCRPGGGHSVVIRYLTDHRNQGILKSQTCIPSGSPAANAFQYCCSNSQNATASEAGCAKSKVWW